MEMILPDQAEMLMRIDEMMNSMSLHTKRAIFNKQEKLEHLKSSFKIHSFESKIDINEKEINFLVKRFEQTFQILLQKDERKVENLQSDLSFSMKKLLHVKENNLNQLENIYRGSNPSLGLKEGFAQIVVDGKKSSLKALHVEDMFELHSAQDIITAKVLNKNK